MATLEEIKNDCAAFNAYKRLHIEDEELTLINLKELLKSYAWRLKKIRSIYINLLDIEKIPEEIFLLENLESISFRGKNISGFKKLPTTKKITSFTLTCETMDALPSFLYTGFCNEISIDCRRLKSLSQDTIQLSGDGAQMTLDIDDLSELPPINLSSTTKLFKIQSKALREVDVSFCQNTTIDQLIINCDTLQSIKHIEATHHIRWFECDTQQSLDLSQWTISNECKNLKLSAGGLKLPNFKHASALQTLSLKGVNDEVRHDIGNCANLTDLMITHSKISAISDSLESCQHLQTLSITHSLDFFPKTISRLENLCSLELNDNSISTIDIDWSSLKKLEYLNLINNKIIFTSLAFISDLPKLSRIDIEGNTLESRYVLLHKKRIPIGQWRFCISPISTVWDKCLLDFCAALARTILNEQDKRQLLDFIWDEGLKSEKIFQDKKLLTLALRVNYSPLKNFVSKYVQNFVKKHNGIKKLNKKSVLYLEGKPNTTLTKLKARVSAIGYKLSKILDETVTHVIIGKTPNNHHAFDSTRFFYLTENDVFSLDSQQNPKLLKQQVEQGDTSAMEGVNELLSSPEPANVKIGLKMLETGGTTEEILETVLMLAKSNLDAIVRKQAKQLLAEQGPAKWAAMLNDRQMFKNINELVDEKELKRKIRKIEKAAGLDSAAILSIVFYRRYKQGLRYLLDKPKPIEPRLKKMYAALMEGEHFDFSTGLGYGDFRGSQPKNIEFIMPKTFYPFPKNVLKWHKVTSINLHNIKISSFPEELTLFKDLRKIDLSVNLLESIPPEIEKLTEIEEIDLRFNKFKVFPSHIAKLPNLKKVDLRYCLSEEETMSMIDIPYTYYFYDQTKPKVLNIPDDIKKLMPNCEILV